MVAFQPNPDKETALEDIGWRAKDTLAVDPPRIEKISRGLGRRAKKGRTILVDEDQDPRRNPRREELSDEQLAINKAGMQVLRSWRNIQDAADAPTEPEQAVLPGLEYVDPLVEQKKSTMQDWDRRERDIEKRIASGEIPDIDLGGPDYHFFKRPDEMQK